MNQSAVNDLAKQLALAVTTRATLIAAGSSLLDTDVMRLDKRAKTLAADLDAAFAERPVWPPKITPWTDYRQRNSIPDLDAGNTK